jgi:polar amino acid transport system substrate-binding protein
MLKTCLCGLLCSFLLIATAQCGALEDIQARRQLVVGTKADYPPYGFRAANGTVAGIEPDLAADLAKRLHVSLKIVPVLSSNRIEMLREGVVDVVIATLSITEERRRLAGIVDPPYYVSGAGLLVRHGLRINEATDLSGTAVCAVSGNIFLLELRSRFPKVRAEIFKDLTSAEQGLLGGQCDVLFFDDSPLFYKKHSQPMRFKNFDFQQVMEIDPLPWGIAVKFGDEKGSWGQFISETIIDWHRSGFLLEVEKKWLHGNTVLLQALNAKWASAR